MSERPCFSAERTNGMRKRHHKNFRARVSSCTSDKGPSPKIEILSAWRRKTRFSIWGEETGTDKESEGQLKKCLIEFLVTCGLGRRRTAPS